MDFIEYFSHDHLVIHLLRPKGKRTLCGSKVSKMLVARPKDLVRADKPDTDTLVAKCYECAIARITPLRRVAADAACLVAGGASPSEAVDWALEGVER